MYLALLRPLLFGDKENPFIFIFVVYNKNDLNLYTLTKLMTEVSERNRGCVCCALGRVGVHGRGHDYTAV